MAATVKEHLDGAVFGRAIHVGSAAWADAIPVAEYRSAMIVPADKGVPTAAREYRRRRADPDLVRRYPAIGDYRRTVGLVGASRIGRRVLELPQPFDRGCSSAIRSSPSTRRRRPAPGARPTGLAELFAVGDLVSPYARRPRWRAGWWMPACRPGCRTAPRCSTRHTAHGTRHTAHGTRHTAHGTRHTAHGALADRDALAVELRTGPIRAVLGVTEPEITDAAPSLRDLPDVVLTPHIAESLGGELTRLGTTAVDEVLRGPQGCPSSTRWSRTRCPYRPDPRPVGAPVHAPQRVRCRRSGGPAARAGPCVRRPTRTSSHKEIDTS
nr:hydroxyacid dehydrogenase [Streptomyces sp. NBC_00886]